MNIVKTVDKTPAIANNTSSGSSMSTSGWFHIVGLISAFALGAGFIAALVSVGLSWKLNRELQTDLVKLQTDLTNAQIALGTVEKELAEARTKQAEAEKQLLEIKERLAFRSIDPQKASQISEVLKSFAPQSFDVLWYLDDDESTSFANEIYRVLLNAGWLLKRSGDFLAMSLEKGVGIEYAEEKTADFSPAANALSVALQKAGVASVTITVRSNTDKNVTDRIRIRVGKKP